MYTPLPQQLWALLRTPKKENDQHDHQCRHNHRYQSHDYDRYDDCYQSQHPNLGLDGGAGLHVGSAALLALHSCAPVIVIIVSVSVIIIVINFTLSPPPPGKLTPSR